MKKERFVLAFNPTTMTCYFPAKQEIDGCSECVGQIERCGLALGGY